MPTFCARARARAAKDIPANIVAALMAKLAKEYKPSAEWPQPKPKWFINRIGSHALEWSKWAAPPAATKSPPGDWAPYEGTG